MTSPADTRVMDDLTARTAATYDRIAATHALRSEHPDAAFRAFRARFTAPLPAGARVADLGCGRPLRSCTCRSPRPSPRCAPGMRRCGRVACSRSAATARGCFLDLPARRSRWAGRRSRCGGAQVTFPRPCPAPVQVLNGLFRAGHVVTAVRSTADHCSDSCSGSRRARLVSLRPTNDRTRKTRPINGPI